MRVLVLCDDRWHPANIVRDGLRRLEHRGFKIDWIENAIEWTAERMAEYPVVILTKSNDISATDHRPWIDDKVQSAFVNHVRQGNGLLVVHSGLAGYREMQGMRDLIGGRFIHHPPQCLVRVEPQVDHPLVKGCSAFTVMDEHYFIECNSVALDPIVSVTSEHGAQLGGWTRYEGKGRVCALTMGHTDQIWQQHSFQRLLFNALNWCGDKTIIPRNSSPNV